MSIADKIPFLNVGEGRLNTNFHGSGILLTKLKLFGEGVEVGTCFGDWANNLLMTWAGKKLWCVDIYKQYSEIPLFTQDDFDIMYQRTEERLSVYGDRVKIIREFSVEASKLFKDEQLDFVYIDANHKSGEVMKDLEAWYPKVKTGGLFFGDDYRTPQWMSVINDVNRFFKERQLAVYFSLSAFDTRSYSDYEKDGLDDWYVFK